MKTETQVIEPGAIVRLHSGGPNMTVSVINSTPGETSVATCNWFNEHEAPGEVTVAVSALEVIKAASATDIKFSAELAFQKLEAIRRIRAALHEVNDAVDNANELGLKEEVAVLHTTAGVLSVARCLASLEEEYAPLGAGEEFVAPTSQDLGKLRKGGSEPDPDSDHVVAQDIKDLASHLNQLIRQAQKKGLTVDLRLNKHDVHEAGGEVGYKSITLCAVVSRPQILAQS